MKKCEYSGGLGFADLVASWRSFKISWLRRTETSNSVWTKILDDSLTKINNAISLSCLYKLGSSEIQSIAKKLTNKFWKEVLLSLRNFLSAFIDARPEEILYTPIWNSNFFLKKWQMSY